MGGFMENVQVLFLFHFVFLIILNNKQKAIVLYSGLILDLFDYLMK